MIDPVAASFIHNILFHPLHGDGYQFWSGIGSDISEIALIGAAIGLYRSHNCHAKKCLRIGKHQIEGTPWKVCRKHHPDLPSSTPTAEEIACFQKK